MRIPDAYTLNIFHKVDKTDDEYDCSIIFTEEIPYHLYTDSKMPAYINSMGNEKWKRPGL